MFLQLTVLVCNDLSIATQPARVSYYIILSQNICRYGYGRDGGLEAYTPGGVDTGYC